MTCQKIIPFLLSSDVEVNGKILARDTVELYGKNVTINNGQINISNHRDVTLDTGIKGNGTISGGILKVEANNDIEQSIITLTRLTLGENSTIEADELTLNGTSTTGGSVFASGSSITGGTDTFAGGTDLLTNFLGTAKITADSLTNATSLTIGASNLEAETTNTGTINLNSGELTSKTSGSGTTNIVGDVTIFHDSETPANSGSIANYIVLQPNSILTANADDILGNI